MLGRDQVLLQVLLGGSVGTKGPLEVLFQSGHRVFKTADLLGLSGHLPGTETRSDEAKLHNLQSVFLTATLTDEDKNHLGPS